MTNSLGVPQEPKDLFPQKDQLKNAEILPTSETEATVFPLGAFSNFVLKEQPRLLTEVRVGQVNAGAIANKQRKLLVSLDPNEVSRTINDPDMARFAMLDLSFAMSALIFSGVTPPPEVQRLNARLAQATSLPEIMTFEKNVSINSRLPFSQMRTFTEGDVGDSERRFYYGHNLMDVKMQNTIDIVAQSIDILATQGEIGSNEVANLLTRGADNMKEFAEFMKYYMRMPREHFEVFKHYLAQYPDGTRNGSGAFLGMPRLTLRLVGLTPRYKQFLDEGMRYFPVHEQPDIQRACELAQQGYYLVAQCEGLQGEGQKRVAKALRDVLMPIKDFRLRHAAAVYHFVPQAFPGGLKNLQAELAQTEEAILEDESGAIKGTAGFLPGPLLRNILRMDLRALEILNTIISELGEDHYTVYS